jgi:mRNA-degrading endonuclease RelE of RelBE toxin-antitoxin system
VLARHGQAPGSDVTQDPYRLEVAGPAVRALAGSLPPKVAEAVYAFITGPLLEHPKRVGKPLTKPLAPAFSARRGPYRVLHLIDEEAHTVKVTAVRHRSDAYRG